MKKTIKQRHFISVLLSMCMIAQLMLTASSVRAADGAAKWAKYTGNSAYTGAVTEDASGVVMNSRAAAYYTEKVSVQEGTKISLDVQIPTVVSGANVQYAFGLTTGANSFYTQDNPAKTTTMVTEFTGLAKGNNLTAAAAIRLPGGSRSIKVNASALTNSRAAIKTTTYNIIFEKQAATSDYSWVMTAKEQAADGNTVVMKISKSDIAHDVYANGAYIIAGALNGSANQVKISNVTVTQPEPESETKWAKYTGNSAYTGAVTEDASGVVMNSRAAAYYTEKVSVQEGTKISLDVQIPTVVSGANVQYAFGLTTGANSFYTQDNPAKTTTMVTEFTGLAKGNNLTAAAAIRLPGGSRSIKVNASALTNSRAAIKTTTYNIIFEKQAATSDYSWVMTAKEQAADGNTVVMKISKSDIAHDVYANGAYIIAGALNGSANQVKISNVAVTQPEPGDPEDPNAVWKVIDNMTSDGSLEENAEHNGDATFTNKVAAYYKEKIEITERSKISFKVKFPTASATEMLHYGFSLIDAEGSFYTSSNSASSVSAELQSSSTNKWAVAAIASKKIAPSTGRTFLANIGILASERNTADTFEVVFEKIDETVGDSNYSWKITTTNLTSNVKASYKVKSADVPHELFKNGAYLSVGVMNGNGYTMEMSDLTIGTWEPEPETAWKAVRGYEGMDFTKSSNEAVTLTGGKGGAYRKEAIALQNNMSIALEYEAKVLTEKNSNDFYIMWLNKPCSLANGTDDTGSGYALHMRTSADYSSFTLFMREVVNGKMGTDNANADLKLGGGTINASALNQKVKVTLTRRMQELNGTVYYGSLTVNVAGKDYIKQISMDDVKRILGDTDTELYLSAGSVNNVDNTIEIKNINVSKLQVIPSVDGVWKPIYGYSAETLCAIVNKTNCVELYGKGAAYLTEPLRASSNEPVSISLHMDGLTTDYHNKFSLAVLDRKESFVGDNKSAGTGFVLEFRSFDQYEKGYAVYVSPVTNGKADDFEKMNDNVILGDMSKSEYDISFTRNSNGSWKIKVVDKTYSKTLTYTLDTCKALEALTPGNIYLSAGNIGMDLNAVIGY